MSDSRIAPGLKHLFRALRHRNYRLYFIGQSISLTGTWMSLAAMGWLVYRLTDDPLMLGLVGFSMQFPTFLLAPLGGAISDRWNRKRVLIVTQSCNMLIMLLLAAVTLTGMVQVWHVLVACALLGTIKAFDMPTRQAMVADIVSDKEELSNAIALNSSTFHGARLIGPMIAGALIIPFAGQWSEGVCFLLDGVSYIAVISCLAAISFTPKPRNGEPKHILLDMAEGFTYAFGSRPIRAMLLLTAAVALFGMPYSTLLPVFARNVHGGESGTLGLLMASGGIGALISALYLASRDSVLGLGRIIAIAVLTFGFATVAFALSGQLWLAMALLVLAGGAGITTMVGANTILQTLVDDERRGRVMSLFGMTFMGAMPLGALLYGQSARAIGAPWTVAGGAFICILAGLVFATRLPSLRKVVHPIYIERGVLAPIRPAAVNPEMPGNPNR